MRGQLFARRSGFWARYGEQEACRSFIMARLARDQNVFRRTLENVRLNSDATGFRRPSQVAETKGLHRSPNADRDVPVEITGMPRQESPTQSG
jgi:hypothetical protein